jgi:uncharacterized membrane protein
VPAAPAMTGRSVDRLVFFSDGVVAVAVTVLILPIVGIKGPTGDETIWSIAWANGAALIAYFFTFIIIVRMWTAHHRVLQSLIAYDGVVMWLNTVWLMCIGFLPWPSYLLGSDEGLGHGIGTLYFGTLFVGTLALNMLSSYLRKHPELTDSTLGAPDSRNLRGSAFLLTFALLMVASFLFPQASRYLMLLVPLLAVVFARNWRRKVKPSE